MKNEELKVNTMEEVNSEANTEETKKEGAWAKVKKVGKKYGKPALAVVGAGAVGAICFILGGKRARKVAEADAEECDYTDVEYTEVEDSDYEDEAE